MSITKRTVVLDLKIQADGQVIVYENTEYWEGGFNGTLETTGPRTGRVIDVGDAVTAEDSLVKDVVNGNLHSTARKAARDSKKEAEESLSEPAQ